MNGDGLTYAESLGQIDISRFKYRYLPTTFPSVQPTVPADYGSIAPGFTDISQGENTETRRRLFTYNERIALANKLIAGIGGGGVYTTDAPTGPGDAVGNLKRGFPASDISEPPIPTEQKIAIGGAVILGALLLIGIMKG